MLYFLGLVLLIIGGILGAPTPVAFLLGESYLIPYFAIPAAISLGIGIFLRQKFEHEELMLGNAMVLVASSWIILSILGSIPIMFGSKLSPLDALFESTSGFTATGLTMFKTGAGHIDAPQTIQFWRSLTEWVGGLGVIVLFLTILMRVGKAARKLYEAEARTHRIETSIISTARSIWKIYVLFTVLGIVAFFFAGMPLWEAINHSMTGIATGGFTVTANSFAGYDAPILIVAVIIMLMGAISFIVHRRVIGGEWREFFRNTEVRLMFALIVLSSIALAWSVGAKGGIFQPVSALTGTGFSVPGQGIPSDVPFVSGESWGPLQKSILSVLMISGGGYGSTSSAIKLVRTVIVLGAVYWLIKRSFLPERAVVPLKIGKSVYTEEEVMQAAIYAFVYIIVLVGGALVVMAAMPGESALDVFFDSASAQGNVGLSTGVTSATMPAVAKVTFIIQMLAGRLEILPVVALLGYFIEKVPRRREAV